jgi:hypothetical protein
MQLTFSGLLNQFHRIMQGVLFPTLQEQLGPLSDTHRQLVAVLGLIGVETLIGSWSGGVGRPSKNRRAIARTFVAKAVSEAQSGSMLDGVGCPFSLDALPGNILPDTSNPVFRLSRFPCHNAGECPVTGLSAGIRRFSTLRKHLLASLCQGRKSHMKNNH